MNWNSDFWWHTLGGGALLTAAVTLARLIFDYAIHRGHQREAEARLERLLQARLADADRRLDRSEAELHKERLRATRLEHELACLRQRYDALSVEYASLLQASADAQRSPR